MGGPLVHAEIEEADEYGACIVCPWHGYQISLRTGDSLYQNLQGRVCSKGYKQRVHRTRRADGKILLQLSAPADTDDTETPAKVESDTYAFKPPPPSGPGPSCGGGAPQRPRRSGDVLRGGPGRRAGVPRPVAPMFGPAAGSATSDVARSMCGADGRAPWARPGGAPGAVGSSVPAAESSAADAAAGWRRYVVMSRRPSARSTVVLTLSGDLPDDAAHWFERSIPPST